MKNVNPQKRNGLTATNSQPAKTFTNHASKFIAFCALFVCVDAGLCVVFVVALAQAVLKALAVGL